MSRNVFKIHSYYVDYVFAEGKYASVRICYKENYDKPLAAKFISKRNTMKEPTILKNEQTIAALVQHPHILNVIDVFATKTFIIQISHFYEHNLFSLLKKNVFNLEKTIKISCQLLSAVEYLHQRFICHRDIKLENVLVSKNGQSIKLCDFGLSSFCFDSKLKGAAGSPLYVAPEAMTNKPYNGFSADIWSCGVLIFAMATRTMPYPRDFDFSEPPDFSGLDEKIRPLVESMLSLDPETRPSASQCLEMFANAGGLTAFMHKKSENKQNENPNLIETAINETATNETTTNETTTNETTTNETTTNETTINKTTTNETATNETTTNETTINKTTTNETTTNDKCLLKEENKEKLVIGKIENDRENSQETPRSPRIININNGILRRSERGSRENIRRKTRCNNRVKFDDFLTNVNSNQINQENIFPINKSIETPDHYCASRVSQMLMIPYQQILHTLTDPKATTVKAMYLLMLERLDNNLGSFGSFNSAPLSHHSSCPIPLAQEASMDQGSGGVMRSYVAPSNAIMSSISEFMLLRNGCVSLPFSLKRSIILNRPQHDAHYQIECYDDFDETCQLVLSAGKRGTKDKLCEDILAFLEEKFELIESRNVDY
ncbi:hypothetical protein TRFO_10557 [Tritrichomonas foetus]|uniref:non-specific serine/threonine protein kinase n=1 Tax=Tritrichomonas foetus TaxID=1144522 RepID=A0A1J4J895_9EUKA|nr:hypothetical protein TRFO_10557 [Tritrichomonas foetus]|eukprot:OHS95410.1 hypothetical protein TRFO_10557 [Tritrichomonas foetus]